MKEEEKSRKLKNLINQLEMLSLKSVRITREIKALQEHLKKYKMKKNTIQVLLTKDNPFKIGEEVATTSNYLQQKGKSGIKTDVTRIQVTLKDQNSGLTYTISFKNVRHT